MAKHNVEFDYFHGYESEQFAFYRIPKVLFTDDYFKDLSSDAKVLYGLMLDRMSLSIKNNWIDEEDRVYIIFTLEQVMQYMNCGKDKGVKILAELDTGKGIGLIERVKRGLGKPAIIYVRESKMAKHNVEFDYFHGYESEQFAFYRIPKVLFTDDYFKDLSSDAKVLYGLMLDRMSLSIKNNWIDEEDRVYIIFTLEQVMQYMNCGKDKGVKILAELDTGKGIGLIERVKRGLGKPAIIYVKVF